MKIYFSFLVLLLSLFLLGCGSNQGDDLSDYNFKQGLAGLELSFLDNSPPEKIYPHSDFRIVMELINLGAYDIDNGEISILGLEERYFLVYPLSQSFDEMLGRSLVNPGGDQQFLEFSGTALDLFENAEEYKANFFIKVSYDTEIEFGDTICINPNLYGVYDSGCEIEKKSYRGQGGYLAVTELEEIISPGSGVEFRLIVENKGPGEVGEVILGRAELGGEPLECHFPRAEGDQRRIDFTEQEQKITAICRKSFISGQNSYTTTLAVDFKYEYELVEQKELLMVR